MRTIKDLCELLASNDKLMREKMSDLLALRKIVAIEEMKLEARSRRSRITAANELSRAARTGLQGVSRF